MMLISSVALLATSVPVGVKIGVPLVMGLVAIWLWSRPEQ
ncbi:hypothetical protein APY03_2676 [Variovorax sp. WDL1]|nr:hypothetical protein APY03_2676 [Variovorax sp. WDL1]